MKAATKAIVTMGVSDTLLKGLTLAPLRRGFFCALPAGPQNSPAGFPKSVRSITLGIVRGPRLESSNFRLDSGMATANRA